jgi:hypothetical protein
VVFSSQGIFPRAVTSYRLKGSIRVVFGVLLTSGRREYNLTLKKSRSKICTFQSVIIEPDRPRNLSLRRWTQGPAHLIFSGVALEQY